MSHFVQTLSGFSLANIYCLFFFLVLFIYSSLYWKDFSLITLSKLLVFFFLFLFKLRDFSPAHFIIAHGFLIQVSLPRLRDFSSHISISQVFIPMLFLSVSHLIERFSTWVARPLSVLHLAEFMFRRESNYNSVSCFTFYLVLDFVKSLITWRTYRLIQILLHAFKKFLIHSCWLCRVINLSAYLLFALLA